MDPRHDHDLEVSVAGLNLRVVAESEHDLALFHRILGSAPAHGPTDATIRIGATPPRLPDRTPDFEGPYGDHWDDDGTHSFRHRWGLAAVVTADEAVLGGPAHGHDRWVTVRNSMIFVSARIFLERGLFVVHGAGLRRGEAGLIAIGASGTGKSTLAYAAGRAGWGVLADDMVIVDPRQGDLRLLGIPRVPSIPGEVARLTDAGGDPVPGDARHRRELVGHEMDLGSAAVVGVVICAHSDGTASIERVEPVAALEELIPAFALADLAGPMRRWFPIAARLANGCCMRLAHAADPVDRVIRVPELLDQAVDLCRRHADHRP